VKDIDLKILWQILIIFNLLPLLTFSQDKQDWPASKHRKYGHRFEMKGDYYSAIYHYSKFLESNTESRYFNQKLAELLQEVRNYDASNKYYSKTTQLYKKPPPEVLFNYGLVQKSCGNYSEAIETFKQYRKITGNKKRFADFRKQAKTEIEGCEMAIKGVLTDTNKQIFILALSSSVNSNNSDFSPFAINDSVFYYASFNTDKAVSFDALSGKFSSFSQFYKSVKINNQWEGKTIVTDSFNLPSTSVGNGVICPHRNRFYFTVAETDENGKILYSIWLSELKDGYWSKAVKLSKLINKPGTNNTQPAIGFEPRQNRETLFFISDRKGGKGSKDIWYSILDTKTNEFTEPKNAGSKVNTLMSEATPFIDPETGKLYFSSEGHPGIGGYDIFTTSGALRKWEEPVNIGIPFNSQADDYYFNLISGKTNQGFMVSNRQGGTSMENTSCCDDIYSFNYKELIHIRISGRIISFENDISENTIENFLDKPDIKIPEGGRFVDSALLTLYVKKDKEEFIIKSFVTNANGQYNFKLEQGKEYRLQLSKEGYFTSNYAFSTTKITKSDTIFHDFLLKKIPDKPIVLKNIYYQFNRYNLSDTAKAIIDTTILLIMLNNPFIIAEISSHTDSKGSDDYNLNLSQKRAEGVKNYLISKGISKNRLQAKGYGESIPLLPNENPDGSDNPEARQKNRRTEFKVIGSVPEYQRIIYED